METLDLTPTWRTAVTIYMDILEDQDARPSAKDTARTEILRLATALDEIIQSIKEKK